MMGHKICFSEEIWPIIPKLSLLLLLIWSPEIRLVLLGEHAQAFIIQSNFKGSNTFGTMKISSRQGLFEPLRVYYRARSGGIIGVSLRFSSS